MRHGLCQVVLLPSQVLSSGQLFLLSRCLETFGRCTILVFPTGFISEIIHLFHQSGRLRSPPRFGYYRASEAPAAPKQVIEIVMMRCRDDTLSDAASIAKSAVHWTKI